MSVSFLSRVKGLSWSDTLYKTLTFHDFFIATFPFCLKRAVRRDRQRQEKCIRALKGKASIDVVFFLQNESVWKYDSLYRLMEQSGRFRPTVVISPFNVHLMYDKNECIRVMKKAADYAEAQHYRYVTAYDFDRQRWIDIRRLLHPDILFFSKPYKDTLPAYHLYSFRDKLTVYVPYGISCIDIYRENYNLPFYNLLWKQWVETSFQKRLAEEHALCKGDNVMVTGALSTEKIIDPDYRPAEVWKAQSTPKKRIIWAPHHTVDYLFNFSNFLSNCDQMLELADKYRDQIQFAFKPHPVLKFKLINLWGKEKPAAYYRKWQELDNGQLAEGYYMDLFLTSDALIHDCASFTAEYLYTRKPVLFQLKDPQVTGHWNPFGRKCFDLHYHAVDLEQTEQFIEQVVLGAQDPKKAEREEFFRTCLAPQDGRLPSRFMLDYLNDVLK